MTTMQGTDGPRESRGKILGELTGILAVTTALLYVSESVFGGATLPGGALGWGGLMLGVLLVWLSLKRRGASWDSLGLGRPKSWVWTLLQGLGVAVGVTVVAQVVFQLLVYPTIGVPDASRFAGIAGNPLMLIGGLFSVWTAAAFGEEILFRGYVVERLVRLHGGGRPAWVGAVLAQAAIFGLLHFYQGLSGIVITGIIGLLFGLAFLVVRRNLWALVFAHGLIDTLSLVSIYASG